MEQQAGGNSSNRRRRKQRIKNSDVRTNESANNSNGASVFHNVQKQAELPEPMVPFESVESVRLISAPGEEDSDIGVRVELGLRASDGDDDGDGNRFAVIDPRDLHQTSDFDLWMALRKNVVDVSASQLSVVLGTNYFTSREKLLQDKVRARISGAKNNNDNSINDDDEDDDEEYDGDAIFLNEEEEPNNNTGGSRSNSKACAWGIKMEPLAFAQYSAVMKAANDNDGDEDNDNDNDDDDDNGQHNKVEETGMYLLRHVDPVTQKTYVFGASPDGMVTEQSKGGEPSIGLLEIKSLWGRRNKGSLPEFHNCPSRFYDQIQGQMAICDKEWCDLMLFIPPSGGGSGGGSGGTKKSKRKGTSAKKRKKQAATAASKTRKSRGKNYCIVRVKRNESYWNEKVLPALIRFCDEVEERAAAGHTWEDTTTAATAATAAATATAAESEPVAA